MIILLSSLSFGKMWVSGMFSSKEELSSMQKICEQELKDISKDKKREEASLYTTRFFVGGEGYRYRLQIQTQDDLNSEDLKNKGCVVYELPSEEDLKQESRESSMRSRQRKSAVSVDQSEEQREQDKSLENESVELSTDQASEERAKSQPKLIQRLRFRTEEDGAVKKEVLPQPIEILRNSKEQHEQLSASWKEAKTEHLVYERVLYDPLEEQPLIVEHQYWKQGVAMRLEVNIRQGEGVNSTTIFSPEGKGWVYTGKNYDVAQEKLTEQILKRFSLEGLLSILLNFPEDLISSGPWRLLENIEEVDEEWVLTPLSLKEQIQRVKIGIQSELIHSVSIKDLETEAEIEYRFLDYRFHEQHGFIPWRIEVFHNGYPYEMIVLSKIEINQELGLELFDPNKH
ncbi:MAG: hypothetical protein CMK59_04530 [Proteobacteria bacterium]|nr:hypothetical protein [Pseudomonadota bacterium]